MDLGDALQPAAILGSHLHEPELVGRFPDG